MFSTLIKVVKIVMIQVYIHVAVCSSSLFYSLINLIVVELNDSCPLETDPYWNIVWKRTLAGMTDTQKCPGGEYTTG